MRKFELNRVDAWIIQSKHAMECNKLKDNYSSNLKSMNKTISPFLIKLTMTHKMEFGSSVAFVFVTWDVIWILVTLTFFSNLHMVREYICLYKPVRLQGFIVDGSWMSGTLGSSMPFLWKLAGWSKWHLLSCLFHNITEQG